MTHRLPDGYYWADDLATFERAIIRVTDGFYTVTRCPRHVPGGEKVKHVHDKFVIIKQIEVPE